MFPDKPHIRHCMLYEFHSKRNATQSTNSICEDMVTLLLMFATVKDGLLALVLEILISMTRTVLEGQLKQMVLFYRIFLNRIVDNRLKILNFDQIGFIKQKKTLFSCNGKQKVILLHDKTRPHVAKTVRERIENLGREV